MNVKASCFTLLFHWLVKDLTNKLVQENNTEITKASQYFPLMQIAGAKGQYFGKCYDVIMS